MYNGINFSENYVHSTFARRHPQVTHTRARLAGSLAAAARRPAAVAAAADEGFVGAPAVSGVAAVGGGEDVCTRDA